MSEYIRDRDYYTEISKGNIPGHSIIHKFGSNHAVGTSIVPITKGGVMQMPTVLTSLEILSDDNINDKVGGAGAIEVRIEGIGTGWAAQSETITLNGTTVVPLANQYFRINRMYISSSGSYASPTTPSHDSTITLRTASAGATWIVIDSEDSFGLGQTQQAVVSIETGYKVYLLKKKVTIETGKTASVFLFN